MATDNQMTAIAADSAEQPTPAPAAATAGPASGTGGTPPEATPPCGTPPEATGHARNRGGAPAGNRNALRHGLYAASHRLTLGTLPDGLRSVQDDAYAFRAAIEAAVVDAHGAISLTNACLIATASRWERHGALCLRWLREQHGELAPGERLSFSREIARASAERDKAIERLRLERTTGDWYDDYLAGRTTAAITADVAPTDDYARPVATDASTGRVGDGGAQ